jgi:putative flippase GtrA
LLKSASNYLQGAMTFLWYTLAGGIATAVHYAMLLFLVEVFDFAAASSAALGALCGAAVSYLVNRHVTFHGTAARHQQAVPRFVLIALAGAAINGALVWTGVHVLAWHYLAAQALATILVLALTYRINRSWTFA